MPTFKEDERPPHIKMFMQYPKFKRNRICISIHNIVTFTAKTLRKCFQIVRENHLLRIINRIDLRFSMATGCKKINE